MALPRMTKEEKLAVIRALQEANATMDYPGFNNHADCYGPFVVTSYWCQTMEDFPDYQVIGPGPIVVDTRDYTVEFLGSIGPDRPKRFYDKSLPQGRVKLADKPIPGIPETASTP